MAILRLPRRLKLLNLSPNFTNGGHRHAAKRDRVFLTQFLSFDKLQLQLQLQPQLQLQLPTVFAN